VTGLIPDKLNNMKNWNYINESYREQLKMLMVLDEAFAGGTRVGGLDAVSLLDAGCVDGFKFESGKRYAATDLMSLFVTGQYDALIEALRHYKYVYKCSGLPHILRDIYVKHNKEKALDDLEYISPKNSGEAIWKALIYALAFNNKSNAKTWLRRCEKMIRSTYPAVSEWVKLAKVWGFALGDEDKAHSVLDIAKESAASVSDWICIAMAQMALFSDEKTALKCLAFAKKAERKEMDPFAEKSQYLSSKAYMVLFNDIEKSKACLEYAEELAEGCTGLGECAESWMKILDDNNIAGKLLKRAGRLAKSVSDWLYCALSWKNYFDNSDEALACFHNATKLASKPIDWLECSKVSREMFGVNKEAFNCIRVAEKMADDALDWVLCGQYWKNTFRYEKKALICLDNAENRKGVTPKDLYWCAEAWNILFGDSLAGKRRAWRCMLLAFKKSKTRSEKESIKENLISMFHHDPDIHLKDQVSYMIVDKRS